MKRTWLFPVLSLGIGRLWQSGLYQRWAMLEEKAFLLPHIKNTVRGDMLRKSMHQLRYRRIREDIFFEEANPVSLQALKTMCNLCGLLLVCAAVLFLAESYVPFRRTLLKDIEKWIIAACWTPTYTLDSHRLFLIYLIFFLKKKDRCRRVSDPDITENGFEFRHPVFANVFLIFGDGMSSKMGVTYFWTGISEIAIISTCDDPMTVWEVSNV
ncbi:hypothetical protein Fcan01_23164 [Folsomia candida]|uniref:Uncharacterized protein n=1 Tax=Folsomia candida TaxID=158441 RepID=A0A226DD18_FOLCA|nr:hypothetical protein Fcan01_23164 [Folsomia candida]